MMSTAGDLIGHEGEFRLVGGRTVYEAVMYDDATARSDKPRLARLAVDDDGLRQINRRVEWDTPIEVIRDFTAEADEERVLVQIQSEGRERVMTNRSAEEIVRDRTRTIQEISGLFGQMPWSGSARFGKVYADDPNVLDAIHDNLVELRDVLIGAASKASDDERQLHELKADLAAFGRVLARVQK